MTIEAYGCEARRVLSSAGWPVILASEQIDPVPGLYAIRAAAESWHDLNLEFREGIPLYVGKSEFSLAGRELGQHFAFDPKVEVQTGSSTVRRSFAALLRERLGLHGVPRNKTNPERFANFGLEPPGDALVTAWMHEHLRLVAWPIPTSLSVSDLRFVEIDVIRTWKPPLNIAHNPGRLRHLRLARKYLATEAKEWASESHKSL